MITIGALFVRNAFLVDHGEIKPGIIRYKPPSKKTLPILYKKLFNIPLIVLIYYIELIALNEDVKYYYDLIILLMGMVAGTIFLPIRMLQV